MELRNSLYKLDSTLQNFSEDQLLTVFCMVLSEKFDLNAIKEIIRLTISYLKALERFAQPLFLTNSICTFVQP